MSPRSCATGDEGASRRAGSRAVIAALEGAPGVGKSTLARALAADGVAVVPEVNRLFCRPPDEPADWYLDRQNARWEIAARAAADGGVALLDGDPLQPLWFGWLYPAEAWTDVATVAAFVADRLRTGRMRLPDRYLLLVLDDAARAGRLRERETARGLDPARVAAKVARYSAFAGRQRRYFDALARHFPGWIAVLDAADPALVAQADALLRASADPPDGAAALRVAAEWLRAHPSAG